MLGSHKGKKEIIIIMFKSGYNKLPAKDSSI